MHSVRVLVDTCQSNSIIYLLSTPNNFVHQCERPRQRVIKERIRPQRLGKFTKIQFQSSVRNIPESVETFSSEFLRTEKPRSSREESPGKVKQKNRDSRWQSFLSEPTQSIPTSQSNASVDVLQDAISSCRRHFSPGE